MEFTNNNNNNNDNNDNNDNNVNNDNDNMATTNNENNTRMVYANTNFSFDDYDEPGDFLGCSVYNNYEITYYDPPENWEQMRDDMLIVYKRRIQKFIEGYYNRPSRDDKGGPTMKQCSICSVKSNDYLSMSFSKSHLVICGKCRICASEVEHEVDAHDDGYDSEEEGKVEHSKLTKYDFDRFMDAHDEEEETEYVCYASHASQEFKCIICFTADDTNGYIRCHGQDYCNECFDLAEYYDENFYDLEDPERDIRDGFSDGETFYPGWWTIDKIFEPDMNDVRNNIM